jgi:hypothetical protein
VGRSGRRPATNPLVRSFGLNENAAIFDLYRVGFQIDANRRAFRFAGAIVEPSIVFGTFDGRSHDETIGEMNVLMRAQTVRGEVLIIRAAEDCKTIPAMIDADDIFRIDCVGGAGVYPIIGQWLFLSKNGPGDGGGHLAG